MSKTYDAVASRDEEAVRRLVADNLNLVRAEARRQAAKWAGEEPAGVQTLPARDRAMVEMRFGIATGVPATLREVGKAFGVSTTRADKVINRALLRLRAAA